MKEVSILTLLFNVLSDAHHTYLLIFLIYQYLSFHSVWVPSPERSARHTDGCGLADGSQPATGLLPPRLPLLLLFSTLPLRQWCPSSTSVSLTVANEVEPPRPIPTPKLFFVEPDSLTGLTPSREPVGSLHSTDNGRCWWLSHPLLKVLWHQIDSYDFFYLSRNEAFSSCLTLIFSVPSVTTPPKNDFVWPHASADNSRLVDT